MGSAAKIMKASIFFLVLASASAAPQFEGLKNIFSALSGDDEPGEVNGDYEQVPYTILKKYDGYEMRQYPSVNWACTEATYQGEGSSSNNIVKILLGLAKSYFNVKGKSSPAIQGWDAAGAKNN